MSLLERSIPLIGVDGEKKLNNSSVIVFGVGGVGSWCAEALVRCGIGRITVVDGDTVSETNKNRQLIALSSTEGHEKAETSAKRLRDINPDCEVTSLNLFYSAETKDEIDLTEYDYIADCIDTVTSKLLLITSANVLKVPIISSMGTGNRLDPTSFKLGDISETAKTGAGCGLARVMRKELKDRGITSQMVLYSTEPAKKCVISDDGRNAPGSISFCPPVAGYILASKVIKDLIEK